MRIGVPRESVPGERRVAVVPDAARLLAAAGHAVMVEPGAGARAGAPDAAYVEAGAALGDPWEAELVLKVAPPSPAETARLAPGTLLVGFLAPLSDPRGIRALAAAGVTAFAMESIPRISRAQTMDALSSQATVTGYRAVIVGCAHLGRFLPMLMTAAGTVRPAQVLVLGAGVAGLQAVATARRLGAVVTAFDVRAAVREQVESLGARFLEVEGSADAEGGGGYARALTEDEQARQRAGIAAQAARSDLVVSTALVPGRRAPVLLDADAVGAMRPGAVVVDLAGEAGGNCALSRPGETWTTDGGVTLAAPLHLASEMAEPASALYARNVLALVELGFDFEDEVVAGACVVRNGEIVHPGARAAVEEAA